VYRLITLRELVSLNDTLNKLRPHLNRHGTYLNRHAKPGTGAPAAHRPTLQIAMAINARSMFIYQLPDVIIFEKTMLSAIIS
jgi:hypothetical protein